MTSDLASPEDFTALGREIIRARVDAGEFPGLDSSVLELMADELGERIEHMLLQATADEMERHGKLAEFEWLIDMGADPAPLLATIPGWPETRARIVETVLRQLGSP